MPPTHLSGEMRSAIGRVVDWRVSFPISPSDIRRWAIAVYFPDAPPRRYWDEDYARSTPAGLTSPEEFNPFAWMVADRMEPAIRSEKSDPDKFEKAIGIAGPGLRNVLNGGSECVYGAPMRPGDVIRSETRLASYIERGGRLGLMLITVTEAMWTNQHNEHVRTSRDTLIRY